MKVWFNPSKAIESELTAIAAQTEGFGPDFVPGVRPADPKFGDYQANGVLGYAKRNQANPRELAQRLIDAAIASGRFAPDLVTLSIAGPGFINFKLSNAFIWQWQLDFSKTEDYRSGAKELKNGRKVVIDYPSANTAKQAHIGHLRPMVIGQAIARLLDFCGADLTRDNHIGDWGTNFGTLIMKIKRDGIDLSQLGDDALVTLDQLYKDGSALETEQPELRDISRNELVLLQNGDSDNTAIWEQIVEISKVAFDKLFVQMGVEVDITLGESFYRDKVERIYQELTEIGLAEESDGALVVWHDEVKKFARDNERPYPFNIRKSDGASNYASTDLATVLYRVEELKAEEIVYLTDARQQDHFQQLFLTTEKWFKSKRYPLPEMNHVFWGTILGSDKKPFKTKSGESIKLQELLDEARSRAFDVVTEKNPELDETERRNIAESIGIGAIKYADLSSNRTQDYIFSWDRLLSFDGNTAPYLLYAVARINSIFRKVGVDPEATIEGASPIETEAEQVLARKLMGFVTALELTVNDLRPHFLCTYLYELTSAYSSFYNADKVMVDDAPVKARRLILCARTRTVLKTGLELLGIQPLERM
ncbi:MAG: arginine--tRNA ligase [Opitutales bacterium]|jgi:arginyl-tRNA synthetase|nr:arginine--tRNA ligase [Opitutales bacterium]MDP4643503.1 arginine--tRNA ligase [Opitutales bacterium]MDP4778134.1 arginine--tRNA ligase [Opitutales bacterium]MDP4883221.1 arginine--tRNA ligase [Opitutales bacterium]